MNTSPLFPMAAAMQQKLQDVLAPTLLEVMDESAAHAGHAGSNGSTQGSHFRVRISSHLFAGKPRVARHRHRGGLKPPQGITQNFSPLRDSTVAAPSPYIDSLSKEKP